MEESPILDLLQTIALVDHQAMIHGPLREMSGPSADRVIGLRAPSHFTLQGCQICKRGRPETQIWLLLVLTMHSILIELP